MDTALKPASKAIADSGEGPQGTSSAKSSFGVFRTLFESGRNNDFEAMADTIAEDCEWVLMPNMKTFKGKKAVVELCKGGKLASEKTPEVLFDDANPTWGVFEYMNRGVITKEFSAFAATSGWKFPGDAGSLVGKSYDVAACFVYHINENGKIYLLHEYLDLGSLMKQLA
jgi:ketosteroid isomerase-like protein